ncbi:unnamed protein product [Spirodela intermedia]|uniref:Reverse transcriptase RNase H-like domain-containing protein n=1 Tax=Spirodela intermedia TaxID=51605 RepID=A0A7I8LCC5_SPIIN|nr:unnamed protein product [Spirodela intermedia]
MTTVVHCLRVWRHYLLGQHFTIYTDNVRTDGPSSHKGDNYSVSYFERHMMCPLLDTRGNRGH